MSAAIAAMNHYQQHLQQVQSNNATNNWLAQLRQRELNAFLARGFPTRHEEEWKYTNTRLLEQTVFTLPAAPTTAIPTVGLELNKPKLVFVDGFFVAALSEINTLPKTIGLTNLNAALKQPNDKLKHYLHDTLSNRFTQLNTALMLDGLWLDIPSNIELLEPLQLIFINTGTDNIICPRNIISVGTNSRITILEEHVALQPIRYFKNNVTQLYLADHAQVEYYKLQIESAQAFHLATTYVSQGHNSKFTSYNFSFGSQLARDDLQIELLGQGAECELNGLYVTNAQQHVDQHTRIEHKVANCTSNECYKGILTDQSSGVFNGKVIVQPQAQQTVAKQTNQNLLLTKTAEINTKPELEIYANDVKCSHGATIGQLDNQALFYLRSRGIDEQAASTLLTAAFANEIINKIKISEIANYITAVMTAKLQG